MLPANTCSHACGCEPKHHRRLRSVAASGPGSSYLSSSASSSPELGVGWGGRGFLLPPVLEEEGRGPGSPTVAGVEGWHGEAA